MAQPPAPLCGLSPAALCESNLVPSYLGRLLPRAAEIEEMAMARPSVRQQAKGPEPSGISVSVVDAAPST